MFHMKFERPIKSLNNSFTFKNTVLVAINCNFASLQKLEINRSSSELFFCTL